MVDLKGYFLFPILKTNEYSVIKDWVMNQMPSLNYVLSVYTLLNKYNQKIYFDSVNFPSFSNK